MKINYININLYIYQFKIFYIFILWILLLFSFIRKEKKTKICLCVIGKNENIYAKEYINHYKQLGYNHIFIYDNNDINGERFEDILTEDIKNGFISIIDYIGYRGIYNNSQREAYYDCYKKNKRFYDWLSFFDFDEFLELNNNKTIQEFLNNKLYKNCQNIKINWLVYTSNKELLYYEQKPLQIRFNISVYNNIANKHIKSTIRGKTKGNFWKKWNTPHSSFNNFNSCSSSGRKVDSSSAFIEPPDYKYASLKHFGIKSFEEFCYKLKRGWPDTTDSMIWIKSIIKGYQNNIEKLNIIKKVFNITNI